MECHASLNQFLANSGWRSVWDHNSIFQPTRHFESDFPGFAVSSVSNMQHINDEEALVRIFYGIAGSIDAGDITPEHTGKLLDSLNFLRRLLTLSVQLPDFAAQRLVC